MAVQIVCDEKSQKPRRDGSDGLGRRPSDLFSSSHKTSKSFFDSNGISQFMLPDPNNTPTPTPKSTVDVFVSHFVTRELFYPVLHV